MGQKDMVFSPLERSEKDRVLQSRNSAGSTLPRKQVLLKVSWIFEIKNYKFIWNLEGCTYLKHITQ